MPMRPAPIAAADDDALGLGSESGIPKLDLLHALVDRAPCRRDLRDDDRRFLGRQVEEGGELLVGHHACRLSSAGRMPTALRSLNGAPQYGQHLNSSCSMLSIMVRPWLSMIQSQLVHRA